MKTLPIILAVLLLAACGSHEAPALSDGLPDGTRTFVQYGRYHSIVPVTLKDGTRCVAILANGASGIDCDFTNTR